MADLLSPLFFDGPRGDLGTRHRDKFRPVPKKWGARRGCPPTRAGRLRYGRVAQSVVNVAPLQRAQEIQQILLLPGREVVERLDHGVRFAAVARMRLNRGKQTAILRSRAPVMQEEITLADSPQRRGAELIAGSCTLRNIVR